MSELMLPCNVEAERAVLASVMAEPDYIAHIAWLPQDAFYLERHAAIWRAMIALYQRRSRPDLVKIASELRASGEYDTAGGMAELGELSTYPALPYEAEEYARQVERAYILRRTIQKAGEVAAKAYRYTGDIDAFSAETQAAFQDATKRAGASDLRPVGVAVERWFRAVQDEQVPGVPTGFYDLDKITRGLHPSTLIILAARPSLGKSSLAQQIAMNVAFTGKRVQFFSIEMDEDRLIARLVAQESRVPHTLIREHTFKDNPEHMRAVLEAAKRIREAPLAIDDKPHTIASLRASALRDAHSNGTPALIVVDYLQRIKPATTTNRNYNRVQEVGQFSGELKALAKELKTTVLCISSTSRAIEARESKRPTMADLRESGDIEFDADVVAFVHREERWDKDTNKKGIAEIIIEKNRDGALGVAELKWLDECARFDNLSKYQAPEGY